MKTEHLARSWVEIDLNRIRENYRIYKGDLSTEIMAVVKADAYGHGAVEVSCLLQEEGVSAFAVSNINEAIELRKSGIGGMILILGYTPIDCIDKVQQYDITQALLSKEYAEDVIATGIKIRCHYAIDTGMNRIGLDAENIDDCNEAIRYAAQYLNVTGLFTHLCVADTPSQYEFTNSQIIKFKAIVNAVSDLHLPEVHCLNSAGGLWYQTEISRYSRLGIILYGLKPDYENTIPDGIKPAMSWKSVISMIKEVKAGESIGYGRSYTAEKDLMIATVPTGYADGYNRALSNNGFVLINGCKAPIVGRVCMDQMMVDISNIEAKPYDEVVLLGDELTADDMAQLLGTIGYEIICDIGKRVERIYI